MESLKTLNEVDSDDRDCISESPPDAVYPEEVELIDIKSPEDHIEQGDIYGEALIKEKISRAFREGQIDAYSKSCEQGYQVRKNRNEKKQKIMDDLSKEINKPWWKIF